MSLNPESITITEQKWTSGVTPLVSISCITYNHQNFIRDAIKGFLMQKTTFPVEILIHDDASTDKTAEIIREYEKKYPHLIKPIYQTENQYSKRDGSIGRIQRKRSCGKYYAACEGDDYWTDPYKLQKQVDFLEANPDFSVCVGGFKKRDTITGEELDVIYNDFGENVDNGIAFTLNDTKTKWLTKTLTAVFRNDSTIIENLSVYKYGRDINLFYHLLSVGKGYYIPQVLGVYNVHEGGINSMKHGKINNTAAYNVYKELYEVNQDEWCRQMNLRHTLNLLNFSLYQKYERNTVQFKFRLFREIVLLLRKIVEIKFLITVFIPSSFKRYFNKTNHIVPIL